MQFDQLELIRENYYQVSKKVQFTPLGKISHTQYLEAQSFAKLMAFSNQGEHRASRSGGNKTRMPSEIFKDTIRGKLSEFALFNFLKLNEIVVPGPDLKTYPLGKWDDVDFEYKSKKINVKSTKKYGNLLLLEQKDWDANANYIPNLKTGNSIYDYFVFIRLGKVKSESNNLCFLIEFDIPGFITLEDLKYVIKSNYFLSAGSYINKTKMDADNYYVQAGNFRKIDELIKSLQRINHF